MLHEFIATGFFVGRLAYAPGTLGTLLGVPLVYLVSFNSWTVITTVVALFVVGLVSSNEVIKLTGDQDPEEVVIDEIVGYIACFTFVEPTLKTYILAFILFRLLDIFKPFPINLFEKLHGAYGVMMDDLVAGIITSIILFLLLK
ncbi:phosphatidylglycerophosphatase A [Hydrogenivirga caldilitoris]|uniref:Phosphatidylglycerophosphatase A n=1 Tax=Hydrogenivirga caldilitoris TaxID=246264 RepID=A0A497XQ48_9AQUI|nr:phosphatidylglycerophosphatase A [Hydrogenivirga caldilitoris]RLJ71085.1 phosphatidylglycerophosphatase A [Hydrogenivirga caldilitoris]